MKDLIGLSAVVTMVLPDKEATKHQIEITVDSGVGSLDADSELAVTGKGLGRDASSSLGTITLSDDGVFYTWIGKYESVTLTPNATFTNDTDNPTYSVYYKSWRE